MLLTGAMLLAALAQQAWGITLADVNLGTHIMGERWDIESLKGRTVYIEFWDVG
jgi:hypothetical protein